MLTVLGLGSRICLLHGPLDYITPFAGSLCVIPHGTGVYTYVEPLFNAFQPRQCRHVFHMECLRYIQWLGTTTTQSAAGTSISCWSPPNASAGSGSINTAGTERRRSMEHGTSEYLYIRIKASWVIQGPQKMVPSRYLEHGYKSHVQHRINETGLPLYSSPSTSGSGGWSSCLLKKGSRPHELLLHSQAYYKSI